MDPLLFTRGGGCGLHDPTPFLRELEKALPAALAQEGTPRGGVLSLQVVAKSGVCSKGQTSLTQQTSLLDKTLFGSRGHLGQKKPKTCGHITQ